MSIVELRPGEAAEEVVVHRCAHMETFDLETESGEVIRVRCGGEVRVSGASTVSEVGVTESAGADVAWLSDDFARRLGSVIVGRIRVRRCVVRDGDWVAATVAAEEGSPSKRSVLVAALRKGGHTEKESGSRLRWYELPAGVGVRRSCTAIARWASWDLGRASRFCLSYGGGGMLLWLLVDAERHGPGSPGVLGAASILGFAATATLAPVDRLLQTDSWFIRHGCLVVMARRVQWGLHGSGLAALLIPAVVALGVASAGLDELDVIWSASYAHLASVTLLGLVASTIERARRRFDPTACT